MARSIKNQRLREKTEIEVKLSKQTTLDCLQKSPKEETRAADFEKKKEQQ